MVVILGRTLRLKGGQLMAFHFFLLVYFLSFLLLLLHHITKWRIRFPLSFLKPNFLFSIFFFLWTPSKGQFGNTSGNLRL